VVFAASCQTVGGPDSWNSRLGSCDLYLISYIAQYVQGVVSSCTVIGDELNNKNYDSAS
jgi:hypothetical protein